MLVEQLQQLLERLKETGARRETLLAQGEERPLRLEEDSVREELPGLLDYLMANSYEFAELLRRVIPVFKIVPLRAIDTGRPVPRAHMTFSFGAMLDRRPPKEYGPRPGDFSVQLDLFDPPAHVQCLEDAVRLHATHPDWSAEKIAEAIGPNVKRWSVRSALKLHEQMEELGVTEPYVPVTDPAKVSRWRMTSSHEARWDQTQ